MKAGAHVSPGVIEVQDWPEPVAGSGQVKVKVTYTGICGSDVEVLHYRHPAMRLPIWPKMPMIGGHEATGTIAEVGPDLKGDWKVGQRVGLSFRAACGVCYYCRTGHENFCEHDTLASGGFAEYALCPEGVLYALPDDIPFELAALIEPTSIAVHAVDQTELLNGQTLCISGGGTIGLLCLAVALKAGAAKVLVSEPMANKRAIALSMGADMAVDPLTEDLAAAGAKLTGGRGFDAVIEASGKIKAAEQALELTDRGGTVVWAGMYPFEANFPIRPFHIFIKELKIHSVFVAPYAFERTLNLLPKLDIGHVVTNIYPLDEIAEAFKNHEKGESIKTLIRM